MEPAVEHTTGSVSRPRGIEALIAGQATSDGAGVRLTRLLTQNLQRRLDPFLMLDLFGSDNPGDTIGGFPAHPHRGFETVTVMIEGRMRHRDSAGNEGLLQPGSVQWMTAGRGVIHSEMPEQQAGAMEGFQLWLNLPARDKLCPPWYRDISAAELPLWQGDGVTARVIAGVLPTAAGVLAGAVQRDATQVGLLDLHFAAAARFELALPADHAAFVVPYRGSLRSGSSMLPARQMAVFDNAPDSDGLQLTAGAEGARALLVSGRPLREPIAQYGPFVMNTQQELQVAVRDFQAGRLA